MGQTLTTSLISDFLGEKSVCFSLLYLLQYLGFEYPVQEIIWNAAIFVASGRLDTVSTGCMRVHYEMTMVARSKEKKTQFTIGVVNPDPVAIPHFCRISDLISLT